MVFAKGYFQIFACAFSINSFQLSGLEIRGHVVVERKVTNLFEEDVMSSRLDQLRGASRICLWCIIGQLYRFWNLQLMNQKLQSGNFDKRWKLNDQVLRIYAESLRLPSWALRIQRQLLVVATLSELLQLLHQIQGWMVMILARH